MNNRNVLREEIGVVLSSVEADLLQFITFVRELEEQYKNQLSNLKTSRRCTQHLEGTKTHKNALVDALNIVKNLLRRISNLLDQFASLPTPEESTIASDESHLVNFYYVHYVYDIAFYLVKLIEENLYSFSETLSAVTFEDEKNKQDRIPLPLTPKDKNLPKAPQTFKFKYFHPATVFNRDGSVYKHQQTRNQKPKLDPPSQAYSNSSDSDPSSTKSYPINDPCSLTFSTTPLQYFSDSSDIDKKEQCYESSLRQISREYNANSFVLQVTKSLNTLISALENALLNLKNLASVKSGEIARDSHRCKRTSPKKHIIRRQSYNHCCTNLCQKCCSSCKLLHKKSGSEEMISNQESSSGSTSLSDVVTEPYWIKKDPVNNVQFLKNINQHSNDKSNADSMHKTTSPNSCEIPNKHHLKKNETRFPTGSETIRTFDVGEILSAAHKNIHSNDDNNIRNIANVRNHKSNSKMSNHGGTRLVHINNTQNETNVIKPNPKFQKRISRGELAPKSSMSRSKRSKKYGKASNFPTPSTETISSRSSSDSSSKVLKRSDFKPDSTKKSMKQDEFMTRINSSTNKSDKSDAAKLKKTKGKTPRRSTTESKLYDDLRQKFFEENFPMDKLDKLDMLSKRKTSDDVTKNSVRKKSYPKQVILKVDKFAKLLENMFRDHFEQNSGLAGVTDYNKIIDMILLSLRNSSNVQVEVRSRREIEAETLSDKGTEEDDSDIEALVKDAISVATEVAKSKDSYNEKSSSGSLSIDSFDIFSTGSRSSEQRLGIVIPKQSDMKSRKSSVVSACHDCANIMSVPDSYDERSRDKFQTIKSLKGSCFRCWNACQRGLAIHRCHDILPSGILEIRHMDAMDKICVCFRTWDQSKEHDDWRWQKNPFYDPTRVEVEQATSPQNIPILKVIYGPEETMVKESLGETRLKTIQNFQAMRFTNPDAKSLTPDRTKSVSKTWMELCRTSRKAASVGKRLKTSDQLLILNERNTMVKLGRFFDDIQKVGYGKGPPLIIFLRKKTPLNDAYDLLMAQSQIPLNYYRAIRVIFIDEKKREIPQTNTNFREEDQSEELFQLFERKLFSYGEMRIFDFPSSESQHVYLNPYSEAHPQWFAFAGAVLALGILHQKQINIKLSLALFKCILDRPLNIHDLQEVDPLLFQKLMWMKENDISSRFVKTTFVMREEKDKVKYEHELLPNGNKIVVTEKNKFRFIDLAVKWKLAERCLTELKDFRRGFASVVDPCFLIHFSPRELQSLLRHPPDEDQFLTESGSGRKDSTKEVSRRETW